MEEHKNLYKCLVCGLMLWLGILPFASCTDDEIVNPQATGKNIGFQLFDTNSLMSRSASEKESLTLHDKVQDCDFSIDVVTFDGIRSSIPAQQPKTRGTQITSANDTWGYKVGAFYSKDGDGTYRDYFDENTSGGFPITNSTEKVTTEYYWPVEGEMTFFAVAPVVDGFSVPASASITNPTITYTIPTKVSEQKDIMVAQANVDCPGNNPVDLQFQHLLTAVQFKVGKMIATRINNLTISGVKGGAITMTYDSDKQEWVYQSSTTVEYSPIYTTNGTPNIDTYGMTEGRYITSDENGMTMFVMPQDLSDAVVKINYTEYILGTTQDIELPLNMSSWEPGNTITYILNVIAETIQIEIPTPPDADAHYVRVDIPYDLSGLNSLIGEGYTISEIIATADWLEDDLNNTASADKQSIYMKKNGNLTEMQKQGYYTDELWEVIIKGNSETGPKRAANYNILGEESLTLENGSSGTIHLFLDENDGTTNRNGELEVIAKIKKTGEADRNVVLGKGSFKQLCPSWNDDGIGIERFEDSQEYSYGFFYDRKIIYTNVNGVEHLNSSWLEQAWNSFISWLASLFGYTTDSILPEIDDAIASGFINKESEKDKIGNEIIKTITVDYSKLGSLNNVNSNITIAKSSDGLENTQQLYDYTGNIDLAQFEKDLTNSLTPNVSVGVEASTGWKREEFGSGAPEDYAAYIALTRNKMREQVTYIYNGNNIESTLYKAILHKENEGTGTGGVNEEGEDIIEWYLPSIEEAKGLKETGTGTEATPISPLHGTYWSSTAGADPNGESIVYGYANSYTYNNNGYVSLNSNENRNQGRKVRAVRKKE